MNGEFGPIDSTTTIDAPTVAAAAAECGPTEKVATRWQFSLWGLMVVMTAVAIGAAVAAVRGVQSFVLSGGVALTAFNAAGYLRHWQTSRWRPRWVGLGWLVFLVSLLLPSVQGCGNDRLAGWEVAWICGSVQIEGVAKIVTQEQSREEFIREVTSPSLEPIVGQIVLLAINLGNLMMLSVPIAWLAWRRERARWLLGILLLGATCAWSESFRIDQDELLYGYYVWGAAMALVLVSQRLPWRYAVVAWSLLVARLWLTD